MESSEDKIAPASGAPGALLAAAREAQGISQREMADRLNWLPSYIGAIETNRFDELRNPAFGRGYLRAYGKLVGVSETQLMTAYDALPDVGEADRKRSHPVRRKVPQVQKMGLAIPAGIAAAVLLVALLWYLQAGDAPNAAAPETAVTSSLTADDAQTDGLVADAGNSIAAVEESATPVLAAEAEAEAEAEESVEAPVLATVEGGNSTVVAIEPVLVEAADEVPVVMGPVLSFSFSGACWVEVRNADAELIYANLHDVGNTLQVEGKAPFDVLVGDARMVTLAYAGEAVPIKSRPGRVIARFTVGE